MLVAVIGDQVGPGNLVSPPSANVFIQKQPVCLTPAVVSPHGNDAHAAATIPQGKNATLFVNKKTPVSMGDVATCGDTVVVTKNSTVYSK